MPIPSIANVQPLVDTFETWVDKTNQIATAMSTVVLTTALTTEGSINTGNAYTNGVFSANVFAATEGLRGGTVASPARLNVVSNVHFQNVGNVSSNSTYLNLKSSTGTLTTGTLTLEGTSVVVTSNLNVKTNTLSITSPGRVGINTATATAALDITGATYLNGNATVTGILSATGNTSLSGEVVSISAPNTYITSNVVTMTANLVVRQSVAVNSAMTVAGNANVGGTLGVVGNTVFSASVGADSLTLTNALAVAYGGTGANTANTARTNLGLGAISTLDTITSSQFTSAVSLAILDSTGIELKKLYASTT